MSTTIQRTCRTHPGGKFTAPKKAGRPPVKCTDEYPCTASSTAITTKKKPPKHQPKTPAAKELVAAGTDDGPAVPQQRIREINDGRDASASKAKRAKEELVALGWTVEGRVKGTQAEITAVRGDELLVMVWDNGQLSASNYTLWSTDRPRENGMPPSELPTGFDPDRMPDREVIEALAGVKVTWWNRLGQRKETAVVSTKRIQISHVYDEEAIRRGTQPSERILSFVDHDGKGIRSFKLAALLKLG